MSTSAKQDMLLSIENFNYGNWHKKFPDHKIDFGQLCVHPAWKEIFEEEFEEEYFCELVKYLSMQLEKGVKIFPYPDFVFSAFNICPLDKIKVVIIGQDPYHNYKTHNKKIVPQAMGLSFSIPVGIQTPSSLRNIYKNQEKFNIIKNIPNHGNLYSWASQGCLMLNSALTVEHGKPNAHQNYWKTFTNIIIEHISEKCNNIVFLLWGRNAYNKNNLIDDDKHEIIHSTHPSGFSFSKEASYGKAFITVNHFKKCNDYLKSVGKEPIVWKLD